ncbi:MAG TPA: hypothetical protein VKX39_16510 [Bryobacteraceae bacterium]|jgi:hypothetical protein|nr:hypothetical protein [Bryobacteraceae bacterium]
MRNTLKIARHHVANLRQALLSPSPEEIERCLPGLAEAAVCLGQIEGALRGEAADPALAGELQALKRDLEMIGRMIRHSAAFYRGWANLLGAAAGGYTAKGQAAEISIAGAVAVRG